MGRRSVGTGVAVGKGGRAHQSLECLVIPPPSDDQPLLAAIGRSEQLEPLKALLSINRTCTRSKTPGQIVSGILWHRDGIDLDDGHGHI